MARCFISPFGPGSLPISPPSERTGEPGNIVGFNVHLSPNAFDPQGGCAAAPPDAAHLAQLYGKLNLPMGAAGESASQLTEMLRTILNDFLFELRHLARTNEETEAVMDIERNLQQALGLLDMNALAKEIVQMVTDQVEEVEQFVYARAFDAGIDAELIKTYKENHTTDANGPVGPAQQFDLILFLVCLIVPEVCEALDRVQLLVTCLKGRESEDFEDGLSFLSCLYTCGLIEETVECAANTFTQCEGSAWLGDIILKGFVQYLNKDHCMLNVLPPADTTPIDFLNANLPEGVRPYSYYIMEGGPAQPIVVHNIMPPGSFCVDFKIVLESPLNIGTFLAQVVFKIVLGTGFCKTTFKVWTTNYVEALTGQYIVPGVPLVDNIEIGPLICRDGFLVSQVKIQEHDYGVNGEQCDIRLTRENFASDFTFNVRATVDDKRDGDRDVIFTLKTVVDGFHRDSIKSKMYVVDNDPLIPSDPNAKRTHSVCRATNDVHITTFDDSYYNLNYDGYFYLYRHKSQPFEVQLMTQRCVAGGTATCNCAAAVKSGDDVFMVDRCRRAGSGGGEPLRAFLFLNGQLTPGTQIFSKFGGLKYEVLLPTGTLVRIITDEKPNTINVMVKPSSTDRLNIQTNGLCGRFSDTPLDDFEMPDGSVYLGPGTEDGGQPRAFIEAWRVSPGSRIFQGAAALPFGGQDPGWSRYCRCHFVLLLGTQCRCDENIAETCDYDTEGDVTDAFVATAFASSFPGDLGNVDWDEFYVPPELPDWGSTDWNENRARSECRRYKGDSSMINRCENLLCPFIENPFNQCRPFDRVHLGCIDDIRQTNSLEWLRSDRESIKDVCFDIIARQLYQTVPNYRRIKERYCLLDCYDRGDCVEGSCQCFPGFGGEACEVDLVDDPVVISVEPTVHCDVTQLNCDHVTLIGHNFLPSDKIKCRVQSLENTKHGYKASSVKILVDSVYISSDQIACRLQRPGNFLVTPVWEGRNQSSRGHFSQIGDSIQWLVSL